MPKIMIKINQNGCDGWDVEETFKDLERKISEGKIFRVTRKDGSNNLLINPDYVVYVLGDSAETEIETVVEGDDAA